MKPYYDRGGVTLYHADCRDVLPTLPQGREGADLLVTDPPYGVNAKTTSNRTRPLPLDRIANDDDTDVSYEGLEAAWLALRVGRHAYVFGPFDLARLRGASATCELIWDKCVYAPGDSLWAKQHEPIQFAWKGDGPDRVAKGHGSGAARVRRGSVLRHQRPHGSGANHHVTEKPVPLLRELIECSSKHGETVLDPFAGSGSTLVAALIEGRRAIGIELEEPWCEVAAKRLDDLTRQVGLFAEVST